MSTPDRKTIPQILREAAQGLRDPERVVLDRSHVFEAADGRRVNVDSADITRACALGHLRLANGGRVRGTVGDLAGQYLPTSGFDASFKEHGPIAVAEAYERAADDYEKRAAA